MKLTNQHTKFFNFFSKLKPATNKKLSTGLNVVKKNKIKAYWSLGLTIFFLVVSIILGFFALAGYKYNIDENGQFTGQSGLTILGLDGTPISNTAAGNDVLLNYSPIVNDAAARIALSVLAVLFITASIFCFSFWFFYFLAYVKKPKKKIDKYDKEQLINEAKKNK